MTSNQKVAIVTGGSSGIGRATAVAKEERAKVVVATRREKEGKETAQLVKEAGSEGIFVRIDVTNEEDVRALVERTVKEYRGLDYALNNAGLDEAETSLIEETSSDFDKIMKTCQRGLVGMKYEIRR